MLLRMVLALLVLLSYQQGTEAAPAWCKNARSEAERTVCARAELWALDACEDQLYRKAQASAAQEARKTVDAAEKVWISRRDLCGADAACIASRYREQMARLDPSGTAPCAKTAAAPSPPLLMPPAALKAAAAARCDGADIASGIRVSSSTPKHVAHGGRIEVSWQLPASETLAGRVFLIGAMPDGVRFEGEFRYNEDGVLENGPGFVALTGASRAPFDIPFGAGRTRIVIPLHDADVSRSGKFWIKPYAAGPLAVEWAAVAIGPGCPGREASLPVANLGPYDVAAGTPRIVVQDFVTPDPLLELATPGGAQRLKEVELSADGRYRLEIFERRYRVFDRASGAKLVDRSGVQPRFSPASRFVVASVGDAGMLHPTNFELIDLAVGNPVRDVTGPIVGWSNGDALLLDATRAYQGIDLISALIDPEFSPEGNPRNVPAFFPGCGTCDAWTGSNIFIDWDRLTVLRGDNDSPAAKALAGLATGRKVEELLTGGGKSPFRAALIRIHGQPEIKLATGWTSNAPLKLTHVGRGYEGYVDDNSLQPAQAGRASQVSFLELRRLALAEGRVLRAADLRPAGATRGAPRANWTPRVRGGPPVLDKGYVADELARFGLRASPLPAIPELPIPEVETQWGGADVIRAWPAALKAEVLAAHPAAKSWFSGEEDSDVIVAAWRLTHQGGQYLLLQHGMPAMTANGAHDLRFDLLAVSGAARGVLHTIGEISGLYSQFVGREHTTARVMTTENGRLVIAIPGSGKAAVVTLGGGFATSIIDMVEATLLCGFHEVEGRALLMQGNCDGQLFVYDPAAGPSPLVSARVVDDELILYNAQGYYAATYEGAHFIHVAFPGLPGVHSFEQFAKMLERPDVIRGLISGTPVALPALALLPPPTLELAMGAQSPGRLAVVADASSASGLSALEFYVDGRLEERRAIAGSHILETVDLPRRAHMRGVTAVAVDRNGFRSRPAALDMPTATGRANNLHVVAIGIDDYDLMPRLEGAQFDAETLVATLKSSASAYYGQVKATIRANREATPAVVEADLRAAVEAAAADDTVLVFYAGHGGKSGDGRYFLSTSQTDPARLPETAIDWSSLAGVLGKARGRVIAVLDACHSGQTERVLTTNDEAVASLAGASAPMVILAASKGRQLSEEMPGADGGVFTQSLARIIGADRKSADSDGDGVLEISELYRSLKQAVVSTTDGRQTPWLVRRNVVGDAPLF